MCVCGVLLGLDCWMSLCVVFEMCVCHARLGHWCRSVRMGSWWFVNVVVCRCVSVVVGGFVVSRCMVIAVCRSVYV